METPKSAVRKLNLGCGLDTKEEYVNLDIFERPGVDVVYDVTSLPLPFEEGSFDEILCNDILEHVDYVPLLQDLHRILAPGGILHVRVPHFTSKNNAIDPTHIRQFSIETFDFFCRDTKIYKQSSVKDLGVAFERYARKPVITFDKANFRRNMIAEWWVNRSPKAQRNYESTWASRIFPALNIELTLIK